MASHSIAADKIGTHENTLVADTEDTVTIADNWKEAEIVSDGTADLYVTGDGSTATVGGANTYRIPFAGGAIVARVRLAPSNGATVKLISSGTPTYTVQKG